MNDKIIKIVILAIMVFISFMVARIVSIFGKSATEISDSVLEWTKQLNDTKFIDKSRKNRIQANLSKLGIMYHLHDYALLPSTYVMCKIFVLIIFIFLAYLFFGLNYILIIAFAIIGYNFLDMIFKSINKKDNEEMSDDIQNMYFTFIIHSEAGVYLLDTIRDCLKDASHPRLREALNEFLNIVLTHRGTLADAINIFESRFDNKDITNLCVVLHQAEETGKSSKILRDLLKQVEKMQAARNYSIEKGQERKMMIILLFFFVGILGLISIGLVQSLLSSFANF